MATLTAVTNKNIADGDQILDAVAQAQNDYLTVVAKFTGIDQDVKIKVEQSVDGGTEYADIAFPGEKEMFMYIKGNGTKALNLVGLHASHIRIKIIKGDATAGVITKLQVYN